jgi:hypothetical protein
MTLETVQFDHSHHDHIDLFAVYAENPVTHHVSSGVNAHYYPLVIHYHSPLQVNASEYRGESHGLGTEFLGKSRTQRAETRIGPSQRLRLVGEFHLERHTVGIGFIAVYAAGAHKR